MKVIRLQVVQVQFYHLCQSGGSQLTIMSWNMDHTPIHMWLFRSLKRSPSITQRVIPTQVIVPMSLSQRLKNLQQEDNTGLSDLTQLQLSDLHHEKVQFGEKHLGKTFSQAWEDQQWINFIAAKYSKSTKMAHRRLIRYIELKVEQHEATQEPIRVVPPPESQVFQSQQHPINPRVAARPKAKAHPASHPGPSTAVYLPDMDTEGWELGMGMSQNGYMENTSNNPDVVAMQARMLNMETALGRVIQHLETQAAIQQQDEIAESLEEADGA